MPVMRLSLNCPGGSASTSRLSFIPSNTVFLSSVFIGVVVLTFIVCITMLVTIETRGFYRRKSSFVNTVKSTVETAPTDILNEDYHYGIVLDCGSSGTRVYVYFWPSPTGSQHELLQIQQLIDRNLQLVSKKISPGLSTYADNPSLSSDYIKPLLDFAARHVPEKKQKETPLYILATAGMRMISTVDQEAILDDLKLDIPLICKFLFSESHVEIISGKQEGLFAWVAMNYIAGRFDHTYDAAAPLERIHVEDSDKPHFRKRTVGIIDMGGGSVQIAFEVPKSVHIDVSKMNNARNYFVEVNLGCKDDDVDHAYRLYVATFLGYGANSARDRYQEIIIRDAATTANNGLSEESAILDPCLSYGMTDTVKVNNTHTFYLKGTGEHSLCKKRLDVLLNTSVTCALEPCSMNGVYQPKIDNYKSEFYGFAEYWYSAEDILRLGGKYSYLRFQKAASQYCGTPWSTTERWYKKNLYPKADWHRFKYQCFKSAWVTTVLHHGFKVPTNYKSFTSAQLVHGKDVQWTLGALIYKTKYYPLSELQKHVSEQFQPPWVKSVVFNQYLLVLCIVVVAFGIILYWRRLHGMQKSEGLKRVPTMTYFMTDADQVEQGITTEWAHTVR